MRAFDAFLPAACSLLAIWLIKQYPLSEGKAHDVRHALETKRKEDMSTSGLSVSLDYPSARA
jgi:Na+/melibiose symporter-like transporter